MKSIKSRGSAKSEILVIDNKSQENNPIIMKTFFKSSR